MFLYFKSLRKKLVSNNKIQKYFFYAIGEIILVVIGILIALSINNWNNNKLLRKAEVDIYKKLENKLIDDRNEMEGIIEYNDRYLAEFGYALEIMKANDRSKLDTLTAILPHLFRYSDFNKSSNIYQNVVNSGELRLLKNDSIVNGLQNIEESYTYLNRLEENHYTAIMTFVGPGIIDNVHFLDGKVERPNDLYSFEVQNLLVSFLDLMQEKDDLYQRSIEEIDGVVGYIRNEYGT